MVAEVIDLGFRPRPWQQTALSSLKRFSVLVVHRRGGKTLGAVMKLIDSAVRCTQHRPRFAYIAPELGQAKGLSWDYLRHYCLKIPGTKVNESELWIELPNGARIRIYGADDPDRLRGLYFDGVVLDEVSQMKPHVWGEILVPALADRSGWALFIGTPKGTNLLSERYFKALDDPAWYARAFAIQDTDALSEDELSRMRENMTDQQWRQEMLCDFNASSEDTLLSIELVQAALGRHVPENAYNFAPKTVGVDVALGGGDKTVIQKRQGLAAFIPHVVNFKDPQDIADVVALTLNAFSADACFVDDSGGYGSGVMSRLRGLGFDPIGVQFGGTARNPRYQDRSAEMWWGVKEWLESGGCLPKNPQYLIELTGRRYSFDNARGKLQLESKKQMRERGLRSPDLADALALTFAAPVHSKIPAPARVINGGVQPVFGIEAYYQGPQHISGTSYDPYARFAEEQKLEEKRYG